MVTKLIVIPIVIVLVAVALIFSGEVQFQTYQGCQLLKPHFGSINCEVTGKDSPINSGTIYNGGNDLNPTGIWQRVCNGKSCTITNINPTGRVYWCLVPPFNCGWDDMCNWNPNSCSYIIEDCSPGGGCTPGSLPMTVIRGHSIRVSQVKDCSGSIFNQVTGQCQGFNAIPSKPQNFVVLGSFEEIKLYKYFDDAHIPIPGTEACTYQSVQKLYNDAGTSTGTQVKETDIPKIPDRFLPVGLPAKDIKDPPPVFDIGYGVVYNQYWDAIPFALNVIEHPTYGDVFCSTNNALYEITKLQDRAGACYAMPDKQLGTVECCSSGECEAKYGPGWYCSQNDGFTCRETVKGCKELGGDLYCNPSGQTQCKLDPDGKYYLVGSYCDTASNECKNSKVEVECCRSPMDTCPDVPEPQWCDETYHCQKEIPGKLPCPFECCTDLEHYFPGKDCSLEGKICCFGVCETAEDCEGGPICNNNGICEAEKGENKLNCPTDCKEFDFFLIMAIVIAFVIIVITAVIAKVFLATRG